jgi:D-alanine-D-alanine ligase
MTRITVITGDHSAPDPTKRDGCYHEEDFQTHEAMLQAFGSLPGYEFSFWNSHERILDALRDDPPDLVPTQELHIPAYLEMLGIPYTGAPPAAMVICYDKAVVRFIGQATGVGVPTEFLLPADDSLEQLPALFPAFIKPNTADGSVGITRDAVVHDRTEARAYLEWLRAELPGRDALWQEYLPGPEYGIGVIGNVTTGFRVLPALEVDYSGLPAGLNPILAFESKAMPDSPYWTRIKFKRAALPASVERRLVAGVERLFKRLGLRDYARFDFRTGADGEPKLIDVNPNPAWATDGKLAFMASFAGIEYRDMLRLIVEAAIARTRAAT